MLSPKQNLKKTCFQLNILDLTHAVMNSIKEN